jgi:hypothetical protein
MSGVHCPAERGTIVMTRDEVLRQRRQMRRRIKDVITERRLLQLQLAPPADADPREAA